MFLTNFLHSTLYIPVRAANTANSGYLIESLETETFGDVKRKIWEFTRIPVEHQIISYRDTYFSYESTVSLSEIMKEHPISKGSAWKIYDSRPVDSGTKATDSGEIIDNSSPCYGYCKNPICGQDNLVQLKLNLFCVRNSSTSLANRTQFYNVDSTKRCNFCFDNGEHKIKIECKQCNALLTQENVLWSVTKDAQNNVLIKFSHCNHVIEKTEYEKKLAKSRSLVVKNESSCSKKMYGEYVFLCPEAHKSLGDKQSLAAYSTEAIFVPDIRQSIQDHLSRLPKELKMSDLIPSRKKEILDHCFATIDSKIRCPSCMAEIDTTSLKTTHAWCGKKCEKFCIHCLKKESEVTEGNLFLHNLDSALNLTKCPLFLDQHPLYSISKVNKKQNSTSTCECSTSRCENCPSEVDSSRCSECSNKYCQVCLQLDEGMIEIYKNFIFWRGVIGLSNYLEHLEKGGEHVIPMLQQEDCFKPYLKEIDFYRKALKPQAEGYFILP